MFRVYYCIVNDHDLRLVLLAAAICVIASFAAITLLQHARRANGDMKLVWLLVSALSTGFGIWATHFIAMLAFSPGVATGYNIKLTFLSLVSAISLTGSGLTIAALNNKRLFGWLGGAIVGGGIAIMHYTGMSAFEVGGIIFWNAPLVVTSIVLAALIGAFALAAALHSDTLRWKSFAAALLTVAICSLHFTGMGALEILPVASAAVPVEAMAPKWLAFAVAGASLTTILLALGAAALDLRDQRRGALEASRMRGLADAAVEGLLVCDGETAVTINRSFVKMVGLSSEQLANRSLAAFIPDREARAMLFKTPDRPIEANLRHVDGSLIPVEMILREIDFGGRPHHVIAVRNLQARKQAEQHIHYLAHHDPLTGLPNRATFAERLDRELSVAPSDKKLAILYLDLDRFKEVNDLFGHAAGDEMLKAVGTRISTILGKDCVLSRLGGDEFAIIVPNLSNPTAAGRIAEDIIATLRGPANAEPISCSIGVAIYPDDGEEREILLGHADTALYRAKAEGRSTYRFFEAKMGIEVRDRRMLEHDLRLAIPHNELTLVYQPQENIKANTITGFEALLRWKHRTRGQISPSVFIPIAEESGAIVSIGEWVLREACREAASWKQPLTIAVNVSAVQLYTENFVPLVHTILLETGLSPLRLELEITETALVRDFNRALTALRQLKALGINIAMDDFGTGYSSLSNLRAFPFDKIKIDGSFIKSVHSNKQAATIVRAVLGLGRGLGLPVLAEGVETSAELSFLEAEFCDEVQGYFVGRPAAIETFATVTAGEAQDLLLIKSA